MDPLKKKRFLWGVLLAWAPWLPATVGLSTVFREITTGKATGLAAVAGGITEAFVLVGLVFTLCSKWLRSSCWSARSSADTGCGVCFQRSRSA